MLRTFRTLAFAALLVGSLNFIPSVRAEDLFPPTGGPRGLSPVDGRSATQAALQELSQARLALLRARVSADQVARGVDAALRGSDEYRDLQRAASIASARFNATRRPIVFGLRRDTEFLRLERERDSARVAIREMVSQQRGTYTQLAPLARVAMDAGRRMTRAESIALALEPAVENARATMTEAFGRLRSATHAHQEALRSDAGIAMAHEEVAAARERVAAANRRLADALMAEASSERAQDRVR